MPEAHNVTVAWLQWQSHEIWAVDGKSDLTCLRAVTQTCRLPEKSSVCNMCWAIVMIFRAWLHLHHQMSFILPSWKYTKWLKTARGGVWRWLRFELQSSVTSHNVHVYFCCNLPPSSECISILHITQSSEITCARGKLDTTTQAKLVFTVWCVLRALGKKTQLWWRHMSAKCHGYEYYTTNNSNKNNNNEKILFAAHNSAIDLK